MILNTVVVFPVKQKSASSCQRESKKKSYLEIYFYFDESIPCGKLQNKSVAIG